MYHQGKQYRGETRIVDVEKKKQIDYLKFIDQPIRISHTTRKDNPLRPVRDIDEAQLSDGVVRSNLRKQVRLRKKAMAALHKEIKSIEEMLNKK